MYCLPEPTGPPAPSLNGVSSCLSAPPRASSTMPVRTIATRTPAGSASRAAASQSRQSCAMKSLPGPADSSRVSSPCGPYQPIAEAFARTLGDPSARIGDLVIAATAFAVERSRLSRSSRLYSAFQRRPKMFAPARLTIASHSLAVACQSPDCVGSPTITRTSGPTCCQASACRESRTTSSPRLRSARTSRTPIKPVPPVTNTRIANPPPFIIGGSCSSV